MSEYTFKLPDLGEGTVEAEIAEWMVKVGDLVAEEDPICAMLTDKAAVELTAPVSGRVVAVAGVEGDMVTVGAPLIVFETEAAAPSAPAAAQTEAPAAAKTKVPAAAAPASAARPGKVMTSPSIRARARAAGIDLAQVPGSGPRGRILQSDLQAFAGPGDAPAAAAARGPAPRERSGTSEIKVIGLRRKIAERMAAAASQIPTSACRGSRHDCAGRPARAPNAQKPPGQDKLTPLAFLGMAMVRVLRDFPQCNAHYDRERNVLVRHAAVHLGIATQTADGLKVPVVHHAEALTLEGLAAEIRRVSTAARDNTASREELSGSTITITSLGKLGGIASTPIINQPEVGIVGVNKMVERPMVINGRVEIRTMMNLSSSFDHRFVDGYDGAAMVQALKELLEQPALIFMP
jgi:2-oxoisovalerate dehydrogenase E2 component (dihydrolipoyl transacylase)